MRLSTQNLLSCPSNQCTYPSNYPLKFRNVERMQVIETEFNESFVKNFVSKIDYNALLQSAKELGNEDLPDMSPDLTNPDQLPDDLLRQLHHVLLEIQDGIANMVRIALSSGICPDSERRQLLAEHEIRK